jgi:hypothetical protein
MGRTWHLTKKIKPNIKLGRFVVIFVLLISMKLSRLEREREEKRKQALKVQLEFAPEDLALATIPG